ncbi:MAG: FitA-like ribbon-helix-helix domain-containing protein [Dichotomicrobium sp.]
MAELTIRDLDDSVIARLNQRARETNRSLEDVVHEILTAAARPGREDAVVRAGEIRESIRARAGGDIPMDATALIREDRDSR